MPVYEYTCKRCDHPFEELVFSGESAACPKCASEELEQRFSTFGVASDSGPTPCDLPAPPPGGCGTCGDPRGPGACSMN